MKSATLFISSILLILSSCTKEATQQTSYLDKWVGEYEGISDHWTAGGGNVYHIYKVVEVDVKRNSTSSSVDLIVTYNGGSPRTLDTVHVNLSGIHKSRQTYQHSSLEIKFTPDSLIYNGYNHNSVGFQDGIDFEIEKK